jgi:hypothetical protein
LPNVDETKLNQPHNNSVAHRPYPVSLSSPRGYLRRVNGVVVRLELVD